MNPHGAAPTLWQRVVGAFVVVQLVFLCAANAFFMLNRLYQRDADEPASLLSETAAILPRLTRPYAELTGQLQGWSLFAPNVPHRAAFVSTELRWHDGRREWAESTTDMPDVTRFSRPLGEGRLMQYDLHLRLLPLTWSPQAAQDNPAEWRRHTIEEVRIRQHALLAYLRWRLGQYHEHHAEAAPPDELVLWARLYDLPAPGQEGQWSEPRLVPLGRWQPAVTPPPGCLPIQMQDLGAWPRPTEHFEWVRASDGDG